MSPNWLGVISAVLAIAGFFVSHRVAGKWPVKKRLAIAAVAFVMAVPGASFAIYYTHLLPEAGWYYQFRSIPGTELLAIFIGIAGGLTAALSPACGRHRCRLSKIESRHGGPVQAMAELD